LTQFPFPFWFPFLFFAKDREKAKKESKTILLLPWYYSILCPFPSLSSPPPNDNQEKVTELEVSKVNYFMKRKVKRGTLHPNTVPDPNSPTS
jgi:hypothetical protein